MSSFFGRLLGGGAAAPIAAGSVHIFATSSGTAHIRLPDASVFPNGALGALTLECWIKSDMGAAWQTMIGFGSSGENPGWYVNSNRQVRLYPGGAGAGAVAAYANIWTHLAVTRDPTNGTTGLRYFIDGTNFYSGPPASFSIDTAFRSLGGDNAGEVLRGRIAEVRCWNVARSDADILAFYNKRLNGNESGLRAYYRLNEGTGSALDLTGINGAGTLTNGAAWSSDGPTLLPP